MSLQYGFGPEGATNATAWNGPICMICGIGYLLSHECDPAVLRMKADDLNSLADRIAARRAERLESDPP